MAVSAEKQQSLPTNQAPGGMKTIAAGQFKAKCLQLLDEVAETRETLIVTKFGKPVAQLVPIPARQDLFGAMRGSVLWEGDIISPLEGVWDLDELT